MKVLRKRRIWTIVLFLAGVGFVFLSFQVFSVEFLSIQNEQQAERSIHKREGDHSLGSRLKAGEKILGQQGQMLNEHLGDKNNRAAKLSQDTCPPGEICNVAQMHNLNYLQKKKELYDVIVGKNGTKDSPALVMKEGKWDVGDVPLVRGVSPLQRMLYISNSNGEFICLHSKETVRYSRVNDDYCDCEDGSDEPGTAACSQGRFYCQFQLDTADLVWLPSSRVNDGICDCCDGSDEWSGAKLPDHVQLNDNEKHYDVYQSPCHDRCDDLRAEKMAKEKLREEGLLRKAVYIEKGRGQADPQNLYGEDRAFYVLSTKCFKKKADKYTYEFCPFREVYQEKSSSKTLIGRSSTWLKWGPSEGYQLKMGDGDSKQCPDRLQKRETIVDFECGLDDVITHIHEDEVCVYSLKFDTPAACH